jgi:hypothetical protein
MLGYLDPQCLLGSKDGHSWYGLDVLEGLEALVGFDPVVLEARGGEELGVDHCWQLIAHCIPNVYASILTAAYYVFLVPAQGSVALQVKVLVTLVLKLLSALIDVEVAESGVISCNQHIVVADEYYARDLPARGQLALSVLAVYPLNVIQSA